MPKNLFSTLLLAGIWAIFAARAGAAQEPGQIVAQRVTGSVLSVNLADNTTVGLQNGDTLTQGFAVRTAKGASAMLVFSNGATVNVGEDTEVSIDQFLQDPFSKEVKVAELQEEPTTSATKLKLTHGEIVGHVRHLHQDQGSTFEVDTPVGAAGIRGTTFQITYQPQGNGKAFFSISTAEGTVVFSSVTNQTIPIPVGQQITVDVTVDPATGAVQLNVQPGALPAGAADAITQLVKGAEDVIFNPHNTPNSPPPTPPAPRTTPGDGG
ncbi:MAG TPA: FecR family protein [Opitutaceae bacterium]|nr:FecR family protein [Opitutaceae bacterium]